MLPAEHISQRAFLWLVLRSRAYLGGGPGWPWPPMATNNGYYGWKYCPMAIHSSTVNASLVLTLVIHNLIVSYDAAHYYNIDLMQSVIMTFLSSFRVVQLVLEIVKIDRQVIRRFESVAVERAPSPPLQSKILPTPLLSVWNPLPDYLRDLDVRETFRQHLKTSRIWNDLPNGVVSAVESSSFCRRYLNHFYFSSRFPVGIVSFTL